MKIFRLISDNILFILTVFLLIFIPLYPKIPLLDIMNTWVYVRVEDFVVLSVLLVFLSFLFRKKVTLKTPLTAPIMFFWIAGAISTIHGIVLFFPNLANVFPNVAFLSFLRHLEYLSLFFVAYASMRNKRFIYIVIAALSATLLGICLYGLGQKYFGFPAFLTSNEEFAKGIPIHLSDLSRVPSTFAGHYDFAAYLVLVIPILVSLGFGIKNKIIIIALFLISALGVVLLLMTVSRVSVFVLLVALFIVFFFQKRKALLFIFPILILSGFLLFVFKPTLLNRFNSTVKEIDVLVDAKTGSAIGEVKFVKSAVYLKDKIIDQARVKDNVQVAQALTGTIDNLRIPEDPLAKRKPLKFPEEIPLVRATNVSTGESLPSGTGYINLSLSPVTRKLGNFYYEVAPDLSSTTSAEVIIIHGSFLIKKAAAYDLSFTTRFQGEWPHALEAFGRNIFFGSGYGSVSLAVDNNYLRMLGEIGLLGTAAFFGIFLAIGVYIKKIWKDIDSRITKSYVIGFIAGVTGLALNATLIDVFEASKVAFSLWILTGIAMGELRLYQTRPVDIYYRLKKAAASPLAIVTYILIITVTIFTPLISNFFVGDDFTWFRWAADCTGSCSSNFMRLIQFFTDSQGFFYRPGTKIFFSLMYSVFWLNPVAYHIVSLALHFIVVSLFFLLARKILRNNLIAAVSSILFLFLSGYSEVIFWVSSIGYLFNAVFALLSILFFVWGEEKKKNIYYILSFLSIIFGLFFHETGMVIPLYIILYKFTKDENFKFSNLLKIRYVSIFMTIPLYLFVRFLSQSHWLSGDYSYDLIKLPFNFIGNAIGYIFIVSLGPIAMPIYEVFREFAKGNALVVSFILLIIAGITAIIFRKLSEKINKESKKIIIFGVLFFVISLLPFLGLGNITSRYSYLASLGFVLVFTYLLKESYNYLKIYGRDIGIMSISILVAVFALLHIIQFQQMQSDWRTAGNKSKELFTSIDELYSSSWSTNAIKLHFVDVPIRVGEAWVFPVGLNDALWFAFRNDNLSVYQHPDLESALQAAGTSNSDVVLKFREDGGVTGVVRFRNGVPLDVFEQ